MEAVCQRLAAIIADIRKDVAASIAHGIAGFLIIRICTQLSRIATGMPQAASRAAWPTRQRPPRVYVPRPLEPLAHPMDGWRRIRLPRREGWLIQLMRPQIIGPCGNYLRILLADPDMATLAATRRARRLLRPLCRMLGVTHALPAPAPRDAAPGTFVATPSPTALAAVPPPVPPAPADLWAQCAMPAQPALCYDTGKNNGRM